jgi:dipeptidyl aminopeptidase/acylaminoacyl peptidase
VKPRLWVFLFVLAAACSANRAPSPVAPTATGVTVNAPTALGPAVLAATATLAPPPAAVPSGTPTLTSVPSATPLTPSATPTLFPLSIAAMRAGSYPGSALTIESTLDPGPNYKRYIASYRSEGLKIYGLLTVPNGTRPPSGWPVIIFNHGYIPPTQYRTTSRYVAYQGDLAAAGYITFKSDYRGNGSSEGSPDGGAYGSPGYVVDVLNAMASIEHYPGADASRVGMWGHSMGGYITLRAMVISHDIKVGVIWSGVVGSYEDLVYHWHDRAFVPPTRTPGTDLPPGRGGGFRALAQQFGSPQDNPGFWNSISATSYLADLSGPLQLHHDTGDTEVPFEMSQTLYNAAIAAGQSAELYAYPGDDHNLANSFTLAMTRTIAYFDKYLKN